MKLKLAENIRKNRREKNLSQEMFAERLGVSFQTISKWERGECYPDIEMLPKIANFFGVTLDALMGTCAYREEEEVAEIQEELRKYDCLRDEVSLLRRAEEGLKLYPNNYLLMAWIVYGAQNIHPKRSIELGEYVLANCRDFHILNWVRAELCYAYFKGGDHAAGIEAARKLPSGQQTRNAVLMDLLQGEAQARHILLNIVAKFGYSFETAILKLLPHYEPSVQIELLKKSNAVYDAIYETDDDVSAWRGKAENYQRMAEISLGMDAEDEAVAYMREALACAEKHDEIPYGVHPKAILCGCDRYDFAVPVSGQLAHPYQKLKEKLVSDFSSEAIFDEALRNMT